MSAKEKVDAWIAEAGPWEDALRTLRAILLDAPLEETVKWGTPCYTAHGQNVVGLAAFKQYVGLWFHQGALLADANGVLVNAQAGKTKALRQWRFERAEDVDVELVRRYVDEAVGLARDGGRVPVARSTGVDLPEELQAALAMDADARAAFTALTPGKQREYAAHVADAKREATRLARVEKALPMIRAGQGLHERYR